MSYQVSELVEDKGCQVTVVVGRREGTTYYVLRRETFILLTLTGVRLPVSVSFPVLTHPNEGGGSRERGVVGARTPEEVEGP